MMSDLWNLAVDLRANYSILFGSTHPGFGKLPDGMPEIVFSHSYRGDKLYVTYYNVPKIDGFYNITLPGDCECPGVVDNPYNYGFKDYEFEEVLCFRRPLSGVKYVRFLGGGAEYAGKNGSLIIYPGTKEVIIGSTVVSFEEFNDVLEEENNIDELVEFFSF